MNRYSTAPLFSLVLFLVHSQIGYAQLQPAVADNFEDGDISANPIWTGQLGDFEVVPTPNTLQLNLNDPDDDGGTSQIGLSSGVAFGRWSLFINMDGFSPSSTNRFFVYLISDRADLSDAVNGYRLLFGETGSADQIRLQKVTNGSATTLLSHPIDIASGGAFEVQVDRRLDGEWSLAASAGFGSVPSDAGSSIIDLDHVNSNHFGLFLQYSSTRDQLFFFDNISIQKFPLQLVFAQRQGSDAIDVAFSEPIDPNSLQPADFVLSGVGSPNAVTHPQPNVARLQFAMAIPGGDYSISVSSVDDLFANTIATNSMLSFILFDEATSFDVVINEIMYDPPSGNAADEYVELFNATSDKVINLKDWLFQDAGNTQHLIVDADFFLSPGQFVTLALDTTFLFNTFGTRSYIQLSSKNALDNGGDQVKIFSNSGLLIDSLRYSSSWGGDGVALERRSAEAPSEIRENWGDSPNVNGGTPGLENEIAQDVQAPQVSSFELIDAQTLRLVFNERLDQSSTELQANYSVSANSISAVAFLPPDTVIITLQSPLNSGESIELSIENVADVFGNAMQSTTLEDTFFLISNPNLGDLVITEILFAPPSGQSDYVEIQNLTNDQFFDLNGLKIADSSGESTISERKVVEPGVFVVISADTTALFSKFGSVNAIQLSSLPNFNSTTSDAVVLRSAEAIVLDSLTYAPNWGVRDTAIERRSLAVSATFRENWGKSPNSLGGTPGRANEILPDTQAPEITSIDVFAKRLMLAFSKTIEPNSVQAENVTLSGGLTVVSLLQTAPDSVEVQLTQNLPEGEDVQVSIQGFEDVFGNAISPTTRIIRFFTISTPDSGDVLISEFLYAPPTGFGDYVELLNRSQKNFRLDSLLISDNRSLFIPLVNRNVVLPAGQWVVISKDSALFKAFPEAFILVNTSLPAFNNTGEDAFVLRTTTHLLDSLTYSSSTWGGQDKALERLSFDVSAVFRENWKESTNEIGSPGQANTVDPDLIPPSLVSVEVLDSQSLVAIFSENVPELSPSQISVGGEAALGVVRDESRWIISLQNPLQPEVLTQVSFIGLTDLFGNQAETQTASVVFFDFASVSASNIHLTEFAYNPPNEFSEFIELRNDGPTINLLGWTFADQSSSTLVSKRNQAFVSGTYIVLAQDSTVIERFPDAQIVVLETWPTLNNSSDAIVIRDSSGTVLDSLFYASAWGGNDVSLERRSTSVPSVFAANWGDSPDPRGASVGEINTIAPDAVPPLLLAEDVISADSVLLFFSEEIVAFSGQVQGNGKTFSVLEFDGDRVRFAIQPAFNAGEEITLQIPGASDLFGNASSDTTISLRFDDFGAEIVPQQIVINEILYRPATGAGEFVELWNVGTEAIDLNGWIFADEGSSITLRSRFGKRLEKSGLFIPIQPDSFLVLTNDPILANQTPNSVFVSNLPALNNAGDAVVLKTPAGLTIDSLSYRSEWGGSQLGTSLERRNPFNASGDPANWGSSQGSPSPGDRNTIFEPDETAPQLIFAEFGSDSTLTLHFSEFIDTTAVTQFSVGGIVEEISLFDRERANIVRLRSQRPANPQVLDVVVDNIRDFSGNEASRMQVPVAYPATPGLLAINEILFDPLANSDDDLPDQSEFIELINPNAFAVSLQALRLQEEADEKGRVRVRQPLGLSLQFIPAGAFAVFHADTTDKVDQWRITNFFDVSEPDSIIRFFRVSGTSLSLTNSEDAIFLSDTSGVVIDSVFYRAEWHNPNLRSTQGISLERIDPLQNANQDFNWASSTAEKGATPGRQNTNFRQSIEQAEENAIRFQNNPFSPDGDGDRDQLIINYKLDQPDYLLRARIFDRYGREIKELVNRFPAGFKGSLIWDGIDSRGKTARIGIYILLLEAFDSAQGSNRNFKEVFVVGQRM